MTQRLPLVAAQPGIWMAEKLSTLPSAWSVAHYVELTGELDAPLLAKAVVAGLEQADTLRMRFSEDNGEVWQWGDSALAFAPPEIIDLREKSDPHAAARALMQADMQQDIRADGTKPLVFHLLIQVGEKRWYWYQRYHHLLVDGFSFPAITRQIAAIYRAWLHGESTPESPFTPFSEVVEEYQQYRQSDAWQRDGAFWTEQRKQLPPPASLSNKPLPGRSASADIIRLKLTAPEGEFRRLAARMPDVQRADLALALVALWLGRLCSRMEYAAGFIFMRRMGSAALTSTGPVLNVLPFGVQLNAAESLPALAQRLAAQLKKMRRHQRYDAEQIVRDSGRAAGAEPLFGPVLNVKIFDYQLNIPGVQAQTHTLATGPVNDLELALFPDENGGLSIEILANKQRYDAATLAQHASRLTALIAQFADNPSLCCGDAGMLLPTEYERLAKMNDTTVAIPSTTLSALVAQQADKTPDAPALADARYQFSYREMRQQVVALARRLRERGVQPGDSVAVALPRSVFLTLALHGIVEAGAAWLPLDTGYPDDRLRMMLEDAKPKLLIATEEQLARFSDIPELESLCYNAPLPEEDAAPLALSQPNHTAYIIFTSGSTGRPKGVMVGQTAIVNRLLWMQNHYPLTADDVVAQKTPCSFDVSVWEFFWPFIAGAKLVMAEPEAHRDPLAMQQFFAQSGVTTTHFVPSMLAAFVASLTPETARESCASLKRVFCSGEALPADLCREWEQLTHAPLHNLYGPTEAAVDVSWYPAWGDDLAAVTGNSVPIGYPVWNTGLRILDAMMRPVPFGVAGDLYLTGIQLAQGYLGRADLTASRFIADPFNPGERMYRTGDVARWLENGAVEYLGRSDDQLKIRGQRIELGEIDRVMQQLPDVEHAVAHACVFNQAAATGGDARQLVGYLVSQSGLPLDTSALRETLREKLPAHMVPTVLLQLAELPLSANGKLDRKALPMPQLTSRTSGRAPRAGTETAIAQSFAALLDCEVNDVEADFFALGGHSLLAMKLAAQLSRIFERQVTPGQIMVASTVEQLSALLESNDDEQSQRLGFETLLPLRESHGPTLFCFHPASGFAWQFSVLSRYLSPQWSIIGIQSPRPDGPMQTAENLDAVCEHHLATLLSQQPHGPYYLLGYSLGGTLAQGIAARLHARGETVAFLGLLDTWPPETQNWQEKEANGLDPAVLAEIEREREAFLAAQQGNASEALFNAIEGNYADAVRLLTTAHSVPFAGHATLFVAERTLVPGVSPERSWSPWISSLDVYRQDCAHVDIITPEAFEKIGPVMRDLLQNIQ
ncbi:enterobactin non-ribosomal peptide synthetase EntF [Citrobacter sp. RHBSTW-00696]|uniref:enterobactin non-ribosomal peptide synthetase EntF n=1 Tax=unclassified Citrobacter TaxID=2644389 RepID=UPI0015EA4BCB|nr:MULTISPECIES: enterobactin non-ribosomal peptide synthetase EntF [unclassified Citrobacter]MBD9977052.1 enterobactin non-ribosomal peptide synthetase EntF [Citrobacter braakii]MBA8088551.1 enterobactin non-ribosomal peptide synthetase EntF [Citrobacter sp. RHBSTW-00089]MBS9490033.1 enterobactin non-ribosomal peptide synthetase EntF [Citrobacter braakii]QLU52152.1 enterobactin non-ribosomal peptide synthetase EntF [Citrobacter sp. RHBSTW-00696]HCB1740856.1 enterobactin non-ribosomal peptide 